MKIIEREKAKPPEFVYWIQRNAVHPIRTKEIHTENIGWWVEIYDGRKYERNLIGSTKIHGRVYLCIRNIPPALTQTIEAYENKYEVDIEVSIPNAENPKP